MNKKAIGTNAGIIWNLLNNRQKWGFEKLKEASGLTDREIYMAAGWLARENKIEIEVGPEDEESYYLVADFFYF